MKKIQLYISILFTIALTACGGSGGDGNTSTGGVFFNHKDLANEFIRRVNMELGYDLDLIKHNTLQDNYIVVWDDDYNEYTAYYIGDYNPGEDLWQYMQDYEHMVHYDLDREYRYDTLTDTWGYSGYYISHDGTRFEKASVSGKNLTTLKAFEQMYAVTKMAEKVVAEYGLSEDKALDVARFSYKMQTSPEGTFKVEDYDNFATELTGSSITDFQTDMKNGNASSLAERIERAAQITGMGPEAMNQLIQDMFMGN